MSQFSKMQHSREQWKHKAKQRGERERYQRKQIARLKAERDRATKPSKRPRHACVSSRPNCRDSSPAQGRRGLLGPPTLFRRSHWLSRRLSRPESTGFGPWHQESAVPANHHQLGHATQHRPHRLGPYAQGLAPEPGALYQRPHLDDRHQYWPGHRQDVGRLGLRCPSPSARSRGPLFGGVHCIGVAVADPGRATPLPRCSSASSPRWAAPPPTSKTAAASCIKPSPYWRSKGWPALVSTISLTPCRGDAQALLPRSPGL